jgi:L-rhamnonate dehydratase
VPPELAGQHWAFKLHVEHQEAGDSVAGVVQLVANSRRVVGPDCPLMIDAWMRWTIDTTLRVAEGIAKHRVAWIEEPLPADDLAGYAELSRRCPIPIAGGEHEFTARGFAQLIEQRLHRVLQPDVCWCGGLTELVKIYQMASQAGLRVCPHRGAEVWGLHAIAALDPEPLAESGRPWMTWVKGQPAIVDGGIRLTDAPGFGVAIDEDQLPLPDWSLANRDGHWFRKRVE